MIRQVTNTDVFVGLSMVGLMAVGGVTVMYLGTKVASKVVRAVLRT